MVESQHSMLTDAPAPSWRSKDETLGLAIFDAAVDAIVTINTDGIIQSANPSALRMFGYAASELHGQNVSILIPDTICDDHTRAIRKYLETGERTVIGIGRDVEGRTKSGRRVPLHLSVGEFTHSGCRFFVGILHDLTDRQARDRSIRQLAAFVESSDDAIFGCSSTNTISYWNSGAELIFGYPRDAIVGKDLCILAPDGDDGRFLNSVRRILGGESVDHFETSLRHENGRTVDVSINMSAVRDTDGRTDQLAIVARDITRISQSRRQQLEDINSQLTTAKDAAQAASTAKTEFLRNMSHEIRTPMTAILGFLDLLEEEAKLALSDDVRREYLLPIRRNGQHLVNIINDILEFSKMEAEKLVVETSEFSPQELINDVIAMIRARAVAKNITLQSEVLTPLPALVASDPTRIRQILLNLLGNALKFTEFGTVTLQVRFLQVDEHPLLEFDVIDTGIGMTEEQQSQLFRPFAQADTTMTRRFGGTGLGLAICKRLAQLLGGDITIVESHPNRGTRFRTRILARNVEVLTDEKTAEKRPLSAEEDTRPPSSSPLDGYRVLLAEDGPDNQKLISRLLRRAGASVTVEGNGRLAVDSALHARKQGIPFDVILMDMQMPVMDGYSATRQLRESGYRRPIVALTAHVMEGEIRRCLASGCDEYLSKPIDVPVFIETLRKLVHNSKSTRVT